MEEFFSFSSPKLLSLLLIVLVLIIWKKKNKKSQTSTSNQPPQPPKLPFIGNIHQLVCLFPHRRLAELAKVYGPLMQLQLGQVTAVVISSPEVAKQLFKYNDINISDRCRVSTADILFYNRQDVGLAPYGEYWRQMRKICVLELLTSKRVQSFRSIREEEISDFITSIRSSKVGSPINLTKMALSLSNSIAARTILGWKNQNQEAVMQMTGRIVKATAGFTVVDMFPSLKFLHVITGMKSSLFKLHKEIDRLLEDIIKEHKSEFNKLGGGGYTTDALLDVLLKLQANPDFPLTTDGIKAIILDMLIAMSDTSPVVLEWAMSELMKNPKLMKKAQEEVRKVRVENGKLNESVIHELKFLKAIIKETLRLHTPAPLLPRLCREECKINGYDIKANTEILVNVWEMARDPNFWIEPEKFNPERFVGSEVDFKGCNFEFIPFGAGRRICAGIPFAIANIELTLAKLLCDFDWELPNQMKPEDLDMSETFAFVINRKNPLYLIPVAPQ